MRSIRLTIDESRAYEEVEIIIKCPKVDERLARLIDQIKQYDLRLVGTKDGRTYSLIAADILYIETIENTSFLYNENHVYESDQKLYEFESMLQGADFIRISKNMIVNTTYIESVRALFNGKFEALLTNSEKVIVNRHYVKAFKENFLT